MKRRLVLFILTLLTMGFIFFQSALPASLSSEQSGFIAKLLSYFFSEETVAGMTFYIRKAGHFTEFTVLGLLLCLLLDGLPLRRIAEERRMLLRRLCAFGIGALYGVSDELHQLFSAGRSCEVRDMAIDAAGVLCGVLLMHLFLLLRKKHKKTA